MINLLKRSLHFWPITSDEYWVATLFVEIDGKRHICGYKSGAFKLSKLYYHPTQGSQRRKAPLRRQGLVSPEATRRQKGASLIEARRQILKN